MNPVMWSSTFHIGLYLIRPTDRSTMGNNKNQMVGREPGLDMHRGKKQNVADYRQRLSCSQPCLCKAVAQLPGHLCLSQLGPLSRAPKVSILGCNCDDIMRIVKGMCRQADEQDSRQEFLSIGGRASTMKTLSAVAGTTMDIFSAMAPLGHDSNQSFDSRDTDSRFSPGLLPCWMPRVGPGSRFRFRTQGTNHWVHGGHTGGFLWSSPVFHKVLLQGVQRF